MSAHSSTSSKIKSLVLLSAGLDSSVNLLEARLVSDVVLALSFRYGQRAADREVEMAQLQCQRLGIRHQIVDLPWFRDFTRTSLVDLGQTVPQDMDIDSKQTEETAKQVWVPNRNGIFLNIAAGFAEGLGASWVIPGFNAEEAATFADNSQAYLESLNAAFAYSTRSKVEVRCFTTHLSKIQIYKRGHQLGLKDEELWPCYMGGPKWCGRCESCLRFSRASGK
jgi:7-cyano-7-deazaguanine synthase